jgi:hypothetical protein
LEPPKKSSTYLRGYGSGFFVVSASFRQNSQNAHYGNLFHHPASFATKGFQHSLIFLDGAKVSGGKISELLFVFSGGPLSKNPETTR